MSRVLRAKNETQAAVFGSIDHVAKVERQRMFGPEPESVEVQVARYQAGEEARRIVGEAYAMAESIRGEAYRSGYDSGWAAGYTHGKTEAETEVNAQAEQFRAEYQAEFQQVLHQLGQASRDLWLNAEPQIVTFVLEIARKVVKHETAVNPEVIAEVVKNALRRHVTAGEGEVVRIRVNAADLENLRAVRTDILTVIDTVRTVEIIEDRRITQGGCVVETGSGTIDASLETQFRLIEEALRDVREERQAKMQAEEAFLVEERMAA